MATTKKTTTAKKTATKATDAADQAEVENTATPDTTAEKSIGAFDKFRDRALALGRQGATVSNAPFILGEDYGFTPDLVLAKPTLKTRMLIQDSMARGDILNALRYMFGNEINRFLDVLEDYEADTGTSGEVVVGGVLLAYMEHFYGKGALDQAFRSLSIS